MGPWITPELKVRLVTRYRANDLEALIALMSSKDWRLGLEAVLPIMIMPCLLFVGKAYSFYYSAKECVRSMPNATFVSLRGLGRREALYRSDLALPHITKFLAKVSQI